MRDSICSDEVFGTDASTATVYTKCASNVIHSALKGVSGTVFAYGQTSSGKTFTYDPITSTPHACTSTHHAAPDQYSQLVLL